MNFRTLAAAAVLTLVVSAPAFAAGGKISVTLQSPVAEKTKVIAGGAVFACEGATCIAASAPDRALTARSCKTLVKEVGAVAAFEGERRALDAAALAACNGAAAPVSQTAAN